MKKILISIILIFSFGIISAQNGMFQPRSVDSTYNMYPCDTCKCYILVIENIGFDDWAESVPLTWYHALEWMTKGNTTFPSSYWILNICDIHAKQKKK